MYLTVSDENMASKLCKSDILNVNVVVLFSMLAVLCNFWTQTPLCARISKKKKNAKGLTILKVHPKTSVTIFGDTVSFCSGSRYVTEHRMSSELNVYCTVSSS